MLLVLSLFGYPVDGLTESSVMGLNEVLKANKYVAEGYVTVGVVVVLLVWICAAACHLYGRQSVLHDLYLRARNGHSFRACRKWFVATVNTGGR
jgi:hypothetical protein